MEAISARLRERSAAFRAPRPGRFAPRYGDLTGGYVVDEWQPDPARIKLPPAETATMNPMQLVVLEAGGQALAGVRALPRATTAVILGSSGLGLQKDGGLWTRLDDALEALAAGPTWRALGDEQRRDVRERLLAGLRGRLKESSADNVIGSLASVAAARIAMQHDLRGPHFAVDADHASALAALEVAVQGLACGAWDCAVTGAASELLTPVEHEAYRQLGVVSPSARPRPLAADADGLVLGEGAVVWVMKRHADALRDGDEILAVVRAVAGVEGGDAPFAPAPARVSRAITAAWSAAGRDPRDAALVSGAASGVAAADRAEAAATADLCGAAALRSPAGIFGHLRAAAGGLSLAEAVLGLRAGGGLAGVTAIALDGQTIHAVLEAPTDAPPRPVQVPAAAPLAVLGVGGVYPGAPDVPAFWDGLLAGRDQVTEVPASRWPIARYHSADGKRRDKSTARKGAFVSLPRPRDGEVAPAAAATLDASQLLAARAAAEAIADAGGAAPAGRVMTFLGFMPFQGPRFRAGARVLFGEIAEELDGAMAAAGLGGRAAAVIAETEAAFCERLPPVGPASLTGWLGSQAAARAAASAGGGRAIAVESACASTLAALHVAELALRTGSCDVALVGGAYADIAPEFYVATSRFNALSPDGIHPFDARAQGFVPGEGAGVLLLARQGRARAWVRGVGGSSDGKGRSVLAPSVDGEVLAVERALAAAALAPADIGYVECHGTGTSIGDAAELAALARVYGAGVRIGSLKSNLGHLIAAAGAPALTKAVLAVERGELPPSLHCERPTPSAATVVRERTPWIVAGPRRAGVSAFGIGGSNYHVIIEEAASMDDLGMLTEAAVPRVVVSAGPTVEACLAKLAGAPPEMADTDEQAGCRVAVVTSGAADLARKLTAARDPALRPALEARGVFVRTDGDRTSTAILFPGQGSQYAGMARELAGEHAVVAELLERADVVWARLTGRPLRPSLWEAAAAPALDLHASVFTVSCALAEIWRAHGLRPDLLIGQSAGELAALVAAGMLSFEDGLVAMHARTAAVLELPLADPGRMDALACGAERLRALLDGGAVLAADNGPSSVLAAGPTAAMDALGARCAAAGIERTALAVSHAYHSPVVAGAAARYRAALERLAWRAPRATVLSTVDLVCYDDDIDATIARLVRQYTTPARFREAVLAAHDRGVRFFLEAGPRWPLTSYVRDTLAGRPHAAQASIHPKIGELAQLARARACAWTHRVAGLTPPPSLELDAGVQQTVVEALAKRTGYPAEVLELDLDLEGDLGIDTVKQAEVFAQVRDALALRPDPTVVLRELNTLRKLIANFSSRLPRRAPLDGFERVREVVLAAYVEKTGYPVEVLELDLDLESDLGIDTVRQAEVYAGVREKLGLRIEEGLALRELNTLRRAITRMAARLSPTPTAAPAPTPPPMPAPKPVEPELAVLPFAPARPRLAPARVTPAPAEPAAFLELVPAPAARPVPRRVIEAVAGWRRLSSAVTVADCRGGRIWGRADGPLGFVGGIDASASDDPKGTLLDGALTLAGLAWFALSGEAAVAHACRAFLVTPRATIAAVHVDIRRTAEVDVHVLDERHEPLVILEGLELRPRGAPAGDSRGLDRYFQLLAVGA